MAEEARLEMGVVEAGVVVALAARHLQRLRKVFECLRVLPLLLEKDAAVVPRVRIPGREIQRLRIIFESLVELPLYLEADRAIDVRRGVVRVEAQRLGVALERLVRLARLEPADA